MVEWFAEAEAIVPPFLKAFASGHFQHAAQSGQISSPVHVYYEWLVPSGNRERFGKLSKLVWDRDKEASVGVGRLVYEAWVRYARLKPHNVFDVHRQPR
jgi:hypothetical protein